MSHLVTEMMPKIIKNDIDKIVNKLSLGRKTALADRKQYSESSYSKVTFGCCDVHDNMTVGIDSVV